MDDLEQLRQSLTSAERRLLNLHYERGLSLADIAVVLGLAAADDSDAIDRAVGKLQGELTTLRQRVKRRGLELGLLGSRSDEATTPVP